MEAVMVKRTDLIDKIESNRAKHLRMYDTAMKVWRQKFADALRRYANRISEMRAKVLRGKMPAMPRIDNMPQPMKYVEQYDRVLGMLRLSVEPNVKLEAEDYDRYIRDKWEWSEAWANSTVGYANAAVKMLRKKAR